MTEKNISGGGACDSLPGNSGSRRSDLRPLRLPRLQSTTQGSGVGDESSRGDSCAVQTVCHEDEATPGQAGALLAGVLAAAKAALPQGLDLLVWGASRLGDQATLRLLLANGGGCSWAPSKDDDEVWGGYSCLRVASMCGHEGAVRELLASGLDMEEVRSDDGVAPLLAAASEGHVGEVGQLLEAGADVNNAKTDVSPWIKPGLPDALARLCFGLLLDGPSAARARLACAGFRDLVGLHRQSLEVIPTALPPGSTAPPARLWSAFPSLRDLTVRIDQGEGEGVGAPHHELVRSLVASLPQLRHLRALRVASAAEDRATKAANAAAVAALPAALAEMPWLSELSLDGQFDLRDSPLLLAGSRLAKLSVTSSGGPFEGSSPARMGPKEITSLAALTGLQSVRLQASMEDLDSRVALCLFLSLPSLAPLTRLEVLDTKGSLDSMHLTALPRLIHLRRLVLVSHRVDDNKPTLGEVSRAASWLPSLERLEARGWWGEVPAGALGGLGEHPSLSDLFLEISDQYQEADAPIVDELPRLRSLTGLKVMFNPRPPPAPVPLLQLVCSGALTTLQQLELDQFSSLPMDTWAPVLRGLQALPLLRKLTLKHMHLSDDFLALLSPLTGLTDLCIEDAFDVWFFVPPVCTPGGLAALRPLASLRSLRLVLTQSPNPAEVITDECLQHIGALTALRELDLGEGCEKISDEGLRLLLPLVNLQKLSLRGPSKISARGLSRLRPLLGLRELVTSYSPRRLKRADLRRALPRCRWTRIADDDYEEEEEEEMEEEEMEDLSSSQ